MDPVQFLTARELAGEFGRFFTENRLRLWRSRGGGPPYRKIQRRCIYKRDEVLAWIDASMRRSTTDPASGDAGKPAVR